MPIAVALLVVIGLLAGAPAAFAQYQGHNFKGDFGVSSGTQPGPGLYALLPYGQWNADAIKDANGNPFARQFNGFDFRLVPLTAVVVTAKKFLGANYGLMAASQPRAADHVGLGMWSHESQGGVTAYLDEAQTISIATTAYFEFHSKKKDLDLKAQLRP